MRHSVVHKDAAGQGEDLRLVLQPPKRRGEDQSIVIALKVCPFMLSFVVGFDAEALTGY